MSLDSQEVVTEMPLDEAIREEILDEIADLEEYAKRGERPPHNCRGYRIRINGERYEVPFSKITGRQVLELAGLKPAVDYTLRVRIAGNKPQKVELDEKIDLTAPGVEKFKATPREQTEGADA